MKQRRMKQILYIFALVAMIFVTACSKESDLAREGQGAVTFALSSNMVRSNTVAPSLLDMVKDKLMFRIYSVSNKGQDNEAQSLVRLYTYDEIIGDGSAPMQIWLLAGDYRVTVEGGDKSEASFTDIYYKGVADFTVEESMTNQQIEISCRPANVMVKVVFDESVADNMGDTGKAVVAFADATSYPDVEGQILTNSIPCLTYKNTAVGYFYSLSGDELPENFVWRFSGKVAAKGDAEVVKEGVYTPAEGFKAGYMYTLTFKYSPDLGGYINLNVAVKTEFDEEDIIGSTATFKPEPQFETGVEVEAGYDNVAGQTAEVYNGKKIGYCIKAINAITELKINVGNEELTYTASQITSSSLNARLSYAEYKDEANGVTIRVVNDKEWNLLLEPTFSQKLGIGKQKYYITVTDDAATKAEYVQDYVGEGVRNLTITAGKEWEGEAKFTADVFNPNADVVTLYYKDNSVGGEYKSVSLVNGSATVAGLHGGRIYDAYISYTLKDQSAPISTNHIELRTPNGVQIPNGGMEEWSQPNKPYLPYISTQWWDSGNHGSTTLSEKSNVTTPASDPRPGSTGTKSAKLETKSVVGKMAAGNIFIGKFLGVNGMNGSLGFGKKFTFDYKPEKLTVWYKGNIGDVTHTGNGLDKGDSDIAQICVWLSNTNVEYYKVDTGDKNTFINPNGTYVRGDKAGQNIDGLVAYGYWNRTQTESKINGVTVNMSYNGWTKIEIPLQYINDTTKPNFLVISCASSAYGDYFAGSTDSYMYVDDFEFVY